MLDHLLSNEPVGNLSHWQWASTGSSVGCLHVFPLPQWKKQEIDIPCYWSLYWGTSVHVPVILHIWPYSLSPVQGTRSRHFFSGIEDSLSSQGLQDTTYQLWLNIYNPLTTVVAKCMDAIIKIWGYIVEYSIYIYVAMQAVNHWFLLDTQLVSCRQTLATQD